MKESAYIDLIEGRPVIDEEKLEAEKKAADERRKFAEEMAK